MERKRKIHYTRWFVSVAENWIFVSIFLCRYVPRVLCCAQAFRGNHIIEGCDDGKERVWWNYSKGAASQSAERWLGFFIFWQSERRREDDNFVKGFHTKMAAAVAATTTTTMQLSLPPGWNTRSVHSRSGYRSNASIRALPSSISSYFSPHKCMSLRNSLKSLMWIKRSHTLLCAIVDPVHSQNPLLHNNFVSRYFQLLLLYQLAFFRVFFRFLWNSSSVTQPTSSLSSSSSFKWRIMELARELCNTSLNASV